MALNFSEDGSVLDPLQILKQSDSAVKVQVSLKETEFGSHHQL